MSGLPRTIDLRLLGQPHALGAHVHDGCLIDPGPSTTVETLLAELDGERPKALLLTHIHLDHAGAAGTLVRHWPDVEVWVHEAGARHMIDPTRLVRSARQVFGADFDRLWGEVLPVPERNLKVLAGGETIGPWRVAYTPGHAKHHVSYLHEADGVAFTGDVTGVRIGEGPLLPPTPPPDIDVGAWHRSLRDIAAWQPTALAFMHFGVNATDPLAQVELLHERLDEFAAVARRSDAAQFGDWLNRWFLERADADALAPYDVSGSIENNWHGLDHYWRTRARDAAEV